MTIAECFQQVDSKNHWRHPPPWPPDAFALCAYLLHKSGAYTAVVSQWPPTEAHPWSSGVPWTTQIKNVGDEWRRRSAPGPTLEPGAPLEVVTWWQQIVNRADMPIQELCEPSGRLVCEAILQVCAAADEACWNIGMPNSADDPFERKVKEIIVSQGQTPSGSVSTLCREIASDRVCILPKCHTPQSGITIRSISHNLALCVRGEVTPDWWRGPLNLSAKTEEELNLLLLPWPLSVAMTHFSAVSPAAARLRQMPDKYGFFNYRIRGGSEWPAEAFARILENGRNLVGRIDGVILPELSLRRDELQAVRDQLSAYNPNSLLIAGVGIDADPAGEFGRNSVACSLPLAGTPSAVELFQDKHHRWQLDASQIAQYGLFRQLCPKKCWWENNLLSPRVLKFMALSQNLTLCCLVCEDLARQDPIADLIRAVGPNLVIALLMDGPQLTSRWPARYATVLADDPGSSVLTLTSIGMTRLSKPLNRPESRVVALWKDSRNGPYEIEMPVDAQGVILSLQARATEEWTADGRSDSKGSATWVLNSVCPVCV